MIYWITAICICAAMLVQYLCSSRIMPMKQAITLNKAGPTRYPLRERTPERAGDVPRQPAGQPPQAISRLSPIPRSSSPPQGEGAGGPRSRVPPQRVGRLRFPGAHGSRARGFTGVQRHHSPAPPSLPTEQRRLARPSPLTPPTRRSRGSTSRGWSGLPCPTPRHWSRCLYQRVPQLFAVFSLLME